MGCKSWGCWMKQYRKLGSSNKILTNSISSPFVTNQPPGYTAKITCTCREIQDTPKILTWSLLIFLEFDVLASLSHFHYTKVDVSRPSSPLFLTFIIQYLHSKSYQFTTNFLGCSNKTMIGKLSTTPCTAQTSGYTAWIILGTPGKQMENDPRYSKLFLICALDSQGDSQLTSYHLVTCRSSQSLHILLPDLLDQTRYVELHKLYFPYQNNDNKVGVEKFSW